MRSEAPTEATADGRLRDLALQLLVDFLLGCDFRCWPGSDGQITEDVVQAPYPLAARAGLVPELEELTRRHPELATNLAGILLKS